MKKASLLLMVSVLILNGLAFGPTIASANSTTNAKVCEDCVEDNLGKSFDEVVQELEEQGTETNLDVNAKSKTRLLKTVKEMDKEEFSERLKEVKKKGFKHEKKADSFVTFTNLKDQDTTYEKVGIVTQFYLKNESELVQKQVFVNMKKNEVIRYDLLQIESIDEGQPFVKELAGYDVKEKSSNNNSGQFQTADFSFNGVSFACSTSGVIACAAAFGGLTVYFPAAGAALSLGCVLAFNAGCSFT
ncbi:putative immunity/bacteriocin fusion bifunctional protein [Salimicrobium halophilum]|uniref:Putative immunity protein/bacteriocin n=1 Tax=Salimicrobium halophilum TaxID=86666 RepID=A0A1G8W5R7_9BACI|nr:putative immunity/bacteriocin fusion bifunctional protein [Salimicrobium halophilum]SDJ73661.1 putative immunity protein/bacteriocin [Salimicrobium halophilum]